MAGAGRAAAAGGPPRPPPCGSAKAAAVERARMETAAIAARRRCDDITKLRNVTIKINKLKCARRRRVPALIARNRRGPGASRSAHEIVIDPRNGREN